MEKKEVLRDLISNELNAKTLTIKSEPIQVIDDEIIEFANRLVNILKFTPGVGIAAPQIGIHKRIIAYKTLLGGVEVLINPEIIERKGIQLGEEGCLSFPHIFGKVYRPQEVVVKALNLQGEEIIIKGKNGLARILSHEIDHLDGVLFVDKVKGALKDPYDLKRKIYDVSKNIAKRENKEGTER